MILSTRSCVLLALSVHPKGIHGNGIIEWVGRQAHGAIRINQGSIYPLLDELAAQGIIDREAPQLGNRGGRPRSPIRLTAAGYRELLATRTAISALLKARQR